MVPSELNKLFKFYEDPQLKHAMRDTLVLILSENTDNITKMVRQYVCYNYEVMTTLLMVSIQLLMLALKKYNIF